VATSAFIDFTERNYGFFSRTERITDSYNAETGFVRRTGFYQNFTAARYTFIPTEGPVVEHGPQIEVSGFTDSDGLLTDARVELNYEATFQNTSEVRVQLSNTYIRLFSSFDPSNTGGAQYEAGEEFRWNNFSARYRSDQRKKFSFSADAEVGGFFSGEGYQAGVNLNYRMQPYGNISMNVSRTHYNFPEPFNDADFWLIGPRFDLTFTRSIFFTTFIQYNEQAQNLNINSRFQWRFKPVSDFFLVYTNNLIDGSWRTRNRGLVAKVTYWLNL
jgi:hypothetical protein